MADNVIKHIYIYLERSISNPNISPKTPKSKLSNNNTKNQTNIILKSRVDSTNFSMSANNTSLAKENHEQSNNINTYSKNIRRTTQFFPKKTKS